MNTVRAAFLVAALSAAGLLIGPAALPMAAQAAPSPSAPAKPDDNGTQGIPNYGDKNQTAATWSLVPVGPDGRIDERPKYSYTAIPGTTITDYMGVSNFSTKPLRLQVYATDALNTDTGQFGLLPVGAKSVDAGTWITPQRSIVTVPARSRYRIPFELKIPANAQPGDHAAGIVAGAAPAKTGDKQQVAVNFRTGSRVYVRVSGELKPQLGIDDVKASYTNNWNPIGRGSVDVKYTVRNVGNVRLAAHQRIFVATFWGSKKQAGGVVDVPELLPGQSANLTAKVDGVLPTVLVKTTVELDPFVPTGVSAPGIPKASASVWLLAVPWSLLAVILGAFVLWRIDRWRTRRHQKGGAPSAGGKHSRGPAPTPTPPVDPNEVLVP